MNAPLPHIHPTVVHFLDAAARDHGEAEAIVAGGIRLTYRQYRSAVARFARHLAALGVRGERVAILLPNGPEICIATWAAHAAGAQVVPLNPLYTERELTSILEDASPRVLLFDAARADLVEPLGARLGITHRLAIAARDPRLLDGMATDTALPQPLPAPGDLAFVQYTGGTTGRSKGVILTHAAVSTNVSQREGLLPVARASERILCVMPLFHSYALAMGLYLAAYSANALVVLPRYHPREVLTALVDERITIFPGSPTIYTGLLAHADFATTDLSRIHTCYSGSAALAVDTLRRWESALGCRVYEGYGQTEAGPVLTYNPVEGVQKPGSVGIVLAGTEVEVVDTETGTRVLPPGEKGEIRARGPQIMSGYRNLPQETADALRDGWLYTGDIGEFDADGYLYIRDRKKDMVIVGGYNVYPREVDDVLFMHPAVLDAAAIGAPDAYRGEVVKAFVALKPGASATPEEILAHCARHLAKYKVPVSLEILAALPKTTVNKTDKKALRVRETASPAREPAPQPAASRAREGGAPDGGARDRSVIVAGAGPVGLTVALVLADAGHHVRLFEALEALPDDPRASTFHPPTLEMLEPYGVTADLHREGVICPHWQIRWHPSGERALFDLSVLQDETKYPYRLQVEQWRLVQALHARLKDHPLIDLRFGMPVTALEQDAGGVTVTAGEGARVERVRAPYLVGADGAHSFVRKAIGLSLEGSTYPETILITETKFPFEAHLEEISFVSYVWRDGGNFSMFRVPDRWRVGMYPLAGMTVEEQLSDPNVERFLQGIVPRGESYEVLAKRPYRTHNRIAPRYRVGRVFVAGDAAHLNSPTGGMGLNGGLHDAFNLAQKLALVLAGRADDALLDRYERQRRPVALAEILAQADRNRARMREQDPAKRRAILRDMQALAADRDRLKAHLLKSSMIDGVRQAARIE